MDNVARLGLQGRFVLVAKHADGSVFATREIINTITDAGENEVAKLLVDSDSPVAFTYIALGTDSTAASDADTQLAAEITTNGGDRAADATPETSANVATVAVLFNFTDTLAIKEVGLLNDPSTGDMLARQVFAVINVGNGDSLTATWNITCGTAR